MIFSNNVLFASSNVITIVTKLVDELDVSIVHVVFVLANAIVVEVKQVCKTPFPFRSTNPLLTPKSVKLYEPSKISILEKTDESELILSLSTVSSLPSTSLASKVLNMLKTQPPPLTLLFVAEM